MLAVLKAGAAFVPLDPTHPTERLKSLCGSIEAKVILCSRGRVNTLSSILDTVIAVDEVTEIKRDTNGRTSIPLPTASTTDIAYVIFTSGSTGKPKV